MTTALRSEARGVAAGTVAARPRPADAFVAFGITGDVAKVMTFRSLYRLERRGLLSCPIIGVAVDDWSLDDLRHRARTAIEGTGEAIDEQVFERFASRLSGIQMLVEAQHADSRDPQQIHLDMEFAEEGGEGATPHEVLLHAAMLGDSTRSTRQDSVEETWRIMQPLLDAPPPVHPYAPGTWGPAAADHLPAGHGRWYGPWVTP